MISFFKKQQFKDISISLSGTLVLQGVNFILLPVITSLYSVQSFGIYSKILSLSTILIPFYTFGLDLGLFGNNKLSKLEVFNATLINSIITFIFFLLSFSLVYVFINYSVYYISIPILGFILAFTQLYKNYLLSSGSFFKEGVFKISDAVLFLLFSFVLSYFFIQGILFSKIIAGIILIIIGVKTVKFEFSFKTYKRIIQSLKHNVFYLSPAQLINILSFELPLILLAIYFSDEKVAFFALAIKLVRFPLRLIAKSLSDVFRLNILILIKNNNTFFNYYIKFFLILILISFSICSLLYFGISDFFNIFFDPKYNESIVVFKILIYGSFFQIVALPLSNIFIVLEKHKLNLCWQLFFLLTIFICTSFGIYQNSFLPLVTYITFGMALSYILNIIISIIMAYNGSILIEKIKND